MTNDRSSGPLTPPFRSSPLPPDAYIPVLTEVLQPAGPSALVAASAARAEAPRLDASPAGRPGFPGLTQEQAEAIHAAVMAELRERLQALVIDRVREQIEPIIQAAMLTALAEVHTEVSRLVEDAVWRAVDAAWHGAQAGAAALAQGDPQGQ